MPLMPSWTELFGEPVGTVLGAGEHQHLAPVAAPDQMRQQGALAAGIDRVDALRDEFGIGVAARHLDHCR